MVVSKLNKKISYQELKRIDTNDQNSEADLYETEIKGIPVIIAIGKQNNQFIKKKIVYFPIYLVKNNYKAIQIGLYEISSEKTLNQLGNDSIIEYFDRPLIYHFASEDFIRAIYLNPQTLKEEKEDREEQDEDKKIEKEKEKELEEQDEDLEEQDEDLEAEKEKREDMEEQDEDLEAEKEKREDMEEHTSNVIISNPTFHSIPDYRKDLFRHVLGKPIPPPLKEISKKELEQIRKSFNDMGNSWVSTYFKNNNYSIHQVPGDGNCFFYTIKDAFMSIGQETTIEQLRNKVASNATEETFQENKTRYDDITKELINIKGDINKLGSAYEILKEKSKSEHDKKTKLSILNESKKIKMEYNKKKDEYESLNELMTDYKFMKKITSLSKFKAEIRKSTFWVDSWAIGMIESLLNIKVIILSSEYYRQGDVEGVLQCSLAGDNVSENYDPDYYIIVEHTGNHYNLITYDNHEIFTFAEIPRDLKELIVNKCMELANNIYNFIPDFASIKQTGGMVIIPDPDSYDSYDENVKLLIHSMAADNIRPGKMPGDEVPLKNTRDFVNLTDPKWRRKMSSEYIEPFVHDGRRWASVEHAYIACRFKPELEDYQCFSLESNNDISKNVKLAKEHAKKLKEDPDFSKKKNKLLEEILYSKWSQPDLTPLLLSTKKARLDKFVRKNATEPQYILMKVRNLLNK